MWEHLTIDASAPARWNPAPTRVQVAAGLVGVLIALSSIGDGPVAADVLRVVGYPTACAAIVRWVPIVRHRHRGWLVAHELAMAAIFVAWALTGRWSAAAGNGAWGVIALVWWGLVGGRHATQDVGPSTG